MKRREFLCCLGYASATVIYGCVAGGDLWQNEDRVYEEKRNLKLEDAPQKKEDIMKRLNEVTYCGFYCPNCGVRCELPERASALRKTMKDGGYDTWPRFTNFWKLLNGLADVSITKRCREETCGAPNCGIRKCAKSKGIEVCSFCEDYPCKMLQTFIVHNPTFLFDGKRMKEIGIDQWIDEQEVRRQNGFCYGDIRCGKENIPEG